MKQHIKKQVRSLYKDKINSEFIMETFNITKEEYLDSVKGLSTIKSNTEELALSIIELTRKYRYTINELVDALSTTTPRIREAIKTINLLFDDLSYNKKLELINDIRTNLTKKTIRNRYYLSEEEIPKVIHVVKEATKKLDAKIDMNNRSVIEKKRELSELIKIRKNNKSKLEEIFTKLARNKK